MIRQALSSAHVPPRIARTAFEVEYDCAPARCQRQNVGLWSVRSVPLDGEVLDDVRTSCFKKTRGTLSFGCMVD